MIYELQPWAIIALRWLAAFMVFRYFLGLYGSLRIGGTNLAGQHLIGISWMRSAMAMSQEEKDRGIYIRSAIVSVGLGFITIIWVSCGRQVTLPEPSPDEKL